MENRRKDETTDGAPHFGRNLKIRSGKSGLPTAFIAALVLALSIGAREPASAQPAQSPTTIEGTLTLLPGNQPTLETGQRTYRLSGQSPYILRTLQDKRLAHQELQVIGTPGPGGDFVVQRLFAVHNGKLYKVEYYCEVCNITSVQPGHCVCCGRETKLKEIPVGDAQ